MKQLFYELRNYVTVFMLAIGVLTLLFGLSIFYANDFEFRMDQTVLLMILLITFIAMTVIYLKQHDMQDILYYHSKNATLKHTYRFFWSAMIISLGVLLYGLLFINIKASIIYYQDIQGYYSEHIDRFVFTLFKRGFYEMILVVWSYVYNLLILISIVTYGIFIIKQRIKHERIYSHKKTIMLSITGLLSIHIFYRLLIYITYRSLSFLDLNHLTHYDLISYGNHMLFVNALYIPAMLIYFLELARMHFIMKQRLNR